MIVALKSRRWFACPACGKGEHSVEHMFEMNMKSAGPWYCAECRLGWLVRVVDESIDVTPAMVGEEQDRFPEQWIVLRRGDLLLLVDGHGTELTEGTRYFYEEGTCPENYLRDVHDVVGVLPAIGNVCRRGEEPAGWTRVALPPDPNAN